MCVLRPGLLRVLGAVENSAGFGAHVEKLWGLSVLLAVAGGAQIRAIACYGGVALVNMQ